MLAPKTFESEDIFSDSLFRREVALEFDTVLLLLLFLGGTCANARVG
jgi:hypothetical protein